MIHLGGATRRLPYQIPTGPPWNAPEPLVTPTYDGSGQTVHPSVVDFARYGGTWNGWRYWMVMTPFPGSNSAYENPSILVSNNGHGWQVPQGLTNPIYPKPAVNYNSDPGLAYDEAGDRLVLIYRDGDFKNRLAFSSDGVTWPGDATILTLSTDHLSPSILKTPRGWEIFGTFGLKGPDTSTDMVTWTRQANTFAGIIPNTWHSEVQYFDGQYWALADRGPDYGGQPDGYRTATSLDGVNWSAGTADIMLPVYDWESTELYRASFQPHEDGENMRVWYSAQADGPVWHIGYTIVPRSLWPTPPQ